MGEVTQYARQAYLGTGPKGLLRATKGSKLPHPYRGITRQVEREGLSFRRGDLVGVITYTDM